MVLWFYGFMPHSAMSKKVEHKHLLSILFQSSILQICLLYKRLLLFLPDHPAAEV